MALLSTEFYALLIFCCSRAHAVSLRVARVTNISLPPTRDRHARGGGGGGARSLTRSRARSVALAMAVAVARASRLPGAVRHTCTRARHHCASRASSTLPSPPRAIGMRALRRRRRSLAHSIARTRCGGGGGGVSRLRLTSRASRSTCVTRAHSSLRIARVINFPFPRCAIGTRVAAAAAALARSLDQSRARGAWWWRWRWRWRSVTPRATHDRVMLSIHHAHAPACHHRASRASSTFPFRPRAIGMRVLRRRRRSLARSIARTRCGVGELAMAMAMAVAVAVRYAARHARPRHVTYAPRACTRMSSPHVARVIDVSLSPARYRHARAAAAAALARSLDRANAVWRWVHMSLAAPPALAGR